MTSLLEKLKTLWLVLVHSEKEDIQFSRGLTIRSTKASGKPAAPILRLVKTTNVSR